MADLKRKAAQEADLENVVQVGAGGQAGRGLERRLPQRRQRRRRRRRKSQRESVGLAPSVPSRLPRIPWCRVQVLPLGAGQEVGRSCIIVKYGGKTVMLDCGVHPGFFGHASLPFFDEVDLGEVDVMLVTHFHLDHCAAVPYVTAHTPFRGRVLMTHPTKAIVHTLLKDFVKVSRGGTGEWGVAVWGSGGRRRGQPGEARGGSPGRRECVPARRDCTLGRPPAAPAPQAAAPGPPVLLLPACPPMPAHPPWPCHPGEGLYSDRDLEAAIEGTEVIDFHQTVDVGGIRVTAYRAGHVLGAAMFLVEIGGMRLLYTGDYSRIPDRHMPAADLPEQRPHIVIVESTYGVSRHLSRHEREQRFVERIHTAVARGGRVLLPVVALGRAQELLLILEEYWERHPELHGVPIYQVGGCGGGDSWEALGPRRRQAASGSGTERAASSRPPLHLLAPPPGCCPLVFRHRDPPPISLPLPCAALLPPQASGLARRAISVYQTYIEMMNDDIQAAFTTANPFQFRHIAHLKSAAQFDDVGPCVVMATPSMLQARAWGGLASRWIAPPGRPAGQPGLLRTCSLLCTHRPALATCPSASSVPTERRVARAV